jgi:hypothetical protein
MIAGTFILPVGRIRHAFSDSRSTKLKSMMILPDR